MFHHGSHKNERSRNKKCRKRDIEKDLLLILHVIIRGMGTLTINFKNENCKFNFFIHVFKSFN